VKGDGRKAWNYEPWKGLRASIFFMYFMGDGIWLEGYLWMKVGHLAFGQRANICVGGDNGLVHFTTWQGFSVDTSFRLLIVDLGTIFLLASVETTC